jgi:serine/threonine-protein phosphatase 2A regulatory subunit B'
VIMPIIFPALYELSKGHWNQQISTLILSVLKLFHDMNPKLYDELVSKFKSEQNK